MFRKRTRYVSQDEEEGRRRWAREQARQQEERQRRRDEETEREERKRREEERERQTPLHPSLLVGSNAERWKEVHAWMGKKGEKAMMVWGPVGCGKSFSVRLCAKARGLSVYELTPSAVESPKDLDVWIRHVRRSKTLLGPRIVLVDDVEGFDASYLVPLSSIAFEEGEGMCPLVLTCSNLYDPFLRSFRSLPSVRCKRPTLPDCLSLCPYLVPKKKEEETTLSEGPCRRSLCEKARGDLRQLSFFLSGLDSSVDERHSSVFETTSHLVLRSDVDAWLRHDTGLLRRVLYDSFPSFSTLEEASSLSSAFSDGEGMREDYSDLLLATMASRLEVKGGRWLPSLTLKPRSEGGGGGWYGGRKTRSEGACSLTLPGGRFKDPL